MKTLNNARSLTDALDGRWHGSYGTACCPAHEDLDPSLSITERDGKAALRWMREGRRVRIARPPRGSDFNDMLLGRVPGIEEDAA